MSDNSEEIEPFTFNLAYFIGLFFVMSWLCLFPSILTGYFFFRIFPFSFHPLYLLALIPLFFLLYGIALVSSLVFTKIGFWIIHKRIGYPELGRFKISMDSPRIRTFVIKGNLMGFGMWLYYFFNVDFLRAFWLRRMGTKIGKNVRLSKSLEPDGNIEIGDNTFAARQCLFAGHLMYQNQILFCKTIVGKNCIFEGHSGAVGGLLVITLLLNISLG